MNLTKSSRFKDATWYTEEGADVVIGGAGGIGSWLALMLCRAGFTPVIYDFDIVEEHNIGGQLFNTSQTGVSKVTAVKTICFDFASTDITCLNEKFTESSMGHNYMFSAFDNMQARKAMFKVWKEVVEEWKETSDEPKPVFIDGRLLMEQLTIFCVTPENMDKYEKEYLFDDTEVPDEPCTLKQTSHSAAMIASHMVGFFTNHISNVLQGSDDRNLPFMWEYFIPIDYLNIEL